jgi:antitoxin ParD1/3/4
MSDPIRVSITLSDETMDFVRRKVSSGDFADENELVNAGILAMQEREADVEFWLQHVGGPIYDRMKADPSRGIPADEVLRRIEKRTYATKRSA